MFSEIPLVRFGFFRIFMDRYHSWWNISMYTNNPPFPLVISFLLIVLKPWKWNCAVGTELSSFVSLIARKPTCAYSNSAGASRFANRVYVNIWKFKFYFLTISISSLHYLFQTYNRSSRRITVVTFLNRSTTCCIWT